NLETTTGGNRAGAVDALERIKSSPHHVVGVGSALRLGNDIVDAKRFEHGTHRTTGNDTGTGHCCTQEHLASTVATGHVVVKGTCVAQWHADHLALGLLGSLADCFWNFTGLTVTKTNATLLVTNDHQCGKTETTAALDHFGHAVDVDQAIDEFAFALLNVSAHNSLSSPCSRTAGRPHGQRLQGPSHGHDRCRRRDRRPLRQRRPWCRAPRSACRSWQRPRRSRRS